MAISTDASRTIPRAWSVEVRYVGDTHVFVEYYEYNTSSCPLNSDGTWKEGHPHHYSHVFCRHPVELLNTTLLYEIPKTPSTN